MTQQKDVQKNDSKVEVLLGVFMHGVANLWSTGSDAL